MRIVANFYKVIEDSDITKEDGNSAQILELDAGDTDSLFVRIQSWDETKQHTTMSSLIGKRVSVLVIVHED